jgi:hypothetical protein
MLPGPRIQNAMNSGIEVVITNQKFAMELAKSNKVPYQPFTPDEVKHTWTWQTLHDLPVLEKEPAGWRCVKEYRVGQRQRPAMVDESELVSFVELTHFLSMFLSSTVQDIGFTRRGITRDKINGNEAIRFNVWVRDGAEPAREGMS